MYCFQPDETSLIGMCMYMPADKANRVVPVRQQAGVSADWARQFDKSTDVSVEWELIAESARYTVIAGQPTYTWSATQQVVWGMVADYDLCSVWFCLGNCQS